MQISCNEFLCCSMKKRDKISGKGGQGTLCSNFHANFGIDLGVDKELITLLHFRKAICQPSTHLILTWTTMDDVEVLKESLFFPVK